MIYIKIALFGYLTAALAGFFDKKTSYILGSLSSISFLASGILSYNNDITITLMQISQNVSLSFKLDHLSCIFIIISSISWIAVELFSVDFGMLYRKRMAVLLNLGFFGMAVVFLSNDMLTFLFGYEIMTITSYLLITEKSNSQKGAFLFLAFSELSTILLISAFAVGFINSGNINLSNIKPSDNFYFLFLASLGFIIKMDIAPFHVWMRKAYEKAAANVLAVLSSSVTLVGVYGLFRIISATNSSHLWGILALSIGAISAFWGAVHAAASKGIKTLPAYSTTENNGLILALLGLYVLTLSLKAESTLATFAYLGAVILAFAHSISKTLLFLSIGQAQEALGEDEINNIRGIHSSVGKIPAFGIIVSGLSFGAFPPLIGYAAEWIVLESIFQSSQFPDILDRIISSSSGVLMALAMGFATFAMIKLMGYSALGYDHGKKAKKISVAFMNSAQLILMTAVFLGGILITFEFAYLGHKEFVIGALSVPQGFLLASAKPVFGVIAPLFYAVVISVFFIFCLLIYLKKRHTTKKVTSWNGGLELKENEYFTTSGYSYTIEYILRWIYRTKETLHNKKALVTTKDVAEFPYNLITDAAKKLSFYISRYIMNGNTHQYIAYIVIMFILSFLIF